MGNNELLLDMINELMITDKLVLMKALSEALFEEYFPGGETIREYENRVYEIPIELIDQYPCHPFYIWDDEEISDLAESIKANGVLVPAILRKKKDGRYEMLSGHRRLRACELAEIDTLKSIVLNVSSDEAAIIMVETNRQRIRVRPSEKAFSYKMRKEAIDRINEISPKSCLQFCRNDNEKSLAEIGLESSDTHHINKLIKLTELIPEILDYVDDGKMKLRPAYEISFLSEDMQRDLFESMEYEQCTPSHAQAIRLRRLAERHALTTELIEEMMMEEKPNQRAKVVLRDEAILDQIPSGLSACEQEKYIAEALEFYRNHGR